MSNVGVTLLESLLGEFSNLAVHHALLVLEKTVGTTEEAIERHYLLEETELGISLLLILALDGLLECAVDLGVDLGGGEGAKVSGVLSVLA